jgi:hypothetical protein
MPAIAIVASAIALAAPTHRHHHASRCPRRASIVALAAPTCRYHHASRRPRRAHPSPLPRQLSPSPRTLSPSPRTPVTSTENHRHEYPLAGWERVRLQNSEITATPPPGQTEQRGGKANEKRPKRRRFTSLGPLVSFFYLVSLFPANKVLTRVLSLLLLRRRQDNEADHEGTTMMTNSEPAPPAPSTPTPSRYDDRAREREGRRRRRCQRQRQQHQRRHANAG